MFGLESFKGFALAPMLNIKTNAAIKTDRNLLLFVLDMGVWTSLAKVRGINVEQN